jgi:hypothetical protein
MFLAGGQFMAAWSAIVLLCATGFVSIAGYEKKGKPAI